MIQVKIPIKLKLLITSLVLGFLFSAQAVMAQNQVENAPLLRLLREFSVFINIILAIMAILLVVSLQHAFKYLKAKANFRDKLKLLWHFTNKEPAQLFSQMAQRDKTGTYLQPFESYRRVHLFSQKTFLRALGLITIKIFIFVVLIASLTFLGRYTKAFNTKALESNNFILQLDK